MFPINPPHILIIEDDRRALSLFERFLVREGFIVTGVSDTGCAREALKCFTFDLILCDILMSNETGLEFLRKIRSGAEDYPRNGSFILLSALGDGSDRVAGLKSGADDYIVKPPEPEELTLRILSLLKKNIPPENGQFITTEPKIDISQDLQLDTAKRVVTFKQSGEAISLTETETKVLRALIEANGSPISRAALMKILSLSESDSRGADIMIARLRKKLEADSKNPERLLTVRGEGYVWKN